ncbi:MAG: tetratricopeptide repeat protein, partial [Planctomycetota bacterium]|nr:tetratricopeptide repeat protein [Planctomycetota bacterium]
MNSQFQIFVLAVLTIANTGPSFAQSNPGSNGVSKSAETLSFNKHIAPIIFEHCATCHRPGRSGPFSLLGYEDVSERARRIVTVTNSRIMPPWLPEPGHGRFVGERRLSDRQIDLIRRWVEQGAAEGDPIDRPAVPTARSDWRHGEPDVVVRMAEPFTVPATGQDVFRNFVVPSPVKMRRFVAAAEFRPQNAGVLRHAMVKIDRTGACRELDRRDEGPGFGGIIAPNARNPDEHWVGWAPGQRPAAVSKQMAWRLEPDDELVLQLHLRPNGREQTIQSEVGLYFAKGPPRLRPFGILLYSSNIDIPPGEKEYVVTDEYVLPVRVTALRINPLAHALCRTMQVEAELPDGNRKSLLRIENWDFNWRSAYQFAEQVTLPKGTTLSMRFSYDNSADNGRNPNRPPKRVRYGPEPSNETGSVWIQVATANAVEMAVLKADYDRRVIRKRLARLEDGARQAPDNPDVHVALGMLLLDTGVLDRAITQLEQAVRLNSEHVVAHRQLGRALQASGRPDDAIKTYRRVLELSPGDEAAHNNLGMVLQSQGTLDEAIAHYRKSLKIRPDQIEAHYNLGRAQAAADRHQEAASQFRIVVGLNPKLAEAHFNLAESLDALGHTRQAIKSYREVLRLRPKLPEAHYNLAKALKTTGDVAESLNHAREAARRRPAWPDPLNFQAWILATHPSESVRDGETAVRLARRAV